MSFSVVHLAVGCWNKELKGCAVANCWQIYYAEYLLKASTQISQIIPLVAERRRSESSSWLHKRRASETNKQKCVNWDFYTVQICSVMNVMVRIVGADWVCMQRSKKTTKCQEQCLFFLASLRWSFRSRWNIKWFLYSLPFFFSLFAGLPQAKSLHRHSG